MRAKKTPNWFVRNLLGRDKEERVITVFFLLLYLFIISIITLTGLWS